MDEAAPWALLPSMIGAMAPSGLGQFLSEHLWDEDAAALALADVIRRRGGFDAEVEWGIV